MRAIVGSQLGELAEQFDAYESLRMVKNNNRVLEAMEDLSKIQIPARIGQE